jgi:hypothetical protein
MSAAALTTVAGSPALCSTQQREPSTLSICDLLASRSHRPSPKFKTTRGLKNYYGFGVISSAHRNVCSKPRFQHGDTGSSLTSHFNALRLTVSRTPEKKRLAHLQDSNFGEDGQQIKPVGGNRRKLTLRCVRCRENVKGVEEQHEIVRGAVNR